MENPSTFFEKKNPYNEENKYVYLWINIEVHTSERQVEQILVLLR